MNFKYLNYSTLLNKTILISSITFILVIFSLIFHQLQVHAANNIINSIPGNVQYLFSYRDNNTCLSPPPFNNNIHFLTSENDWIYSVNQGMQYDGSVQQPIIVPIGATNIPLAFVTNEYICFPAVSGYPQFQLPTIKYTGPFSYPRGSIANSYDGFSTTTNCNQGIPDPYFDTNGYYKYNVNPCSLTGLVIGASSTTKINGQTVPFGSLSCIVNQVSHMDYFYYSRYWFADPPPGSAYPTNSNNRNQCSQYNNNPNYFNLNLNFPLTHTTQILINLTQIEIMKWCPAYNNNVCSYSCVANMKPDANNGTEPNISLSGCPSSSIPFTIILVPQSYFNNVPHINGNPIVLPGGTINLNSWINNIGSGNNINNETINISHSSGPGGSFIGPTTMSVPPINSGSQSGNYTTEFTVNSRASPGSQVCFTATVSPATPSLSTSSPANFCTTVVTAPYLSVQGSDTVAGEGFCFSTTSYNPNAQILSWNNNGIANGITSNYALGSGNYNGAMATGSINGFASNLINGNMNPIALSFANTGNPPNTDQFSSGQFGGGFNALSSSCIHNYYNDKPSTLQSLASTTLTGPLFSSLRGNAPDFYYGHSITIGNLSISKAYGKANDPVVYVNGNVYIKNNISVNNPSGTSFTDLSSFKLIDYGGNIIIYPNVTTIDGSYISQPNSLGQGGNIYTCATQSSLTSPPIPGCNNTLTVQGSLVAKKIYFWRYNGSVGTNTPAENITYSPISWLTNLSASTGQTTSPSIQNLPPIL